MGDCRYSAFRSLRSAFKLKRMTNNRSCRPAVLLVGHGTRSERGQNQFLALAEQFRQGFPWPVEPAFLELAEPTIEQGVERLVANRIDRLVVAPLLLFSAGHAKVDIPTAVARALLRCGAENTPCVQSDPLGCHPLIVELAHQRLGESLANRPAVPPEHTLLLAVGRGSNDDVATAEMRRFSALLATRAGIPIWQVAFLAMARPQIAEAIAQVDLNATSRVIVQPHLLFHGDLVEQLRGQVAQTAAERPGQEWIVTGLLADATLGGGESSELLTAAMEDLIEQTLKPW